MQRLNSWVLALFASNFIANFAYADPSAETIFKLKGSIVKAHTFTNSGGHGVGSGVMSM